MEYIFPPLHFEPTCVLKAEGNLPMILSIPKEDKNYSKELSSFWAVFKRNRDGPGLSLKTAKDSQSKKWPWVKDQMQGSKMFQCKTEVKDEITNLLIF